MMCFELEYGGYMAIKIKKKIVLLGDSGVGKTSLIRRFVFDQFDDSYIATIGSKVTKKIIKIESEYKPYELTLMIWDIIGREGYQSLHARTFVGVNGAILVSDITRKSTYESLERYWIPFLFKIVDEVPLVFVCNKNDLKSETDHFFEELVEYASRYQKRINDKSNKGLQTVLLTSAKDGTNVEEAFETLGQLLITKKIQRDPVKELYEGLIATGLQRSSDTSTPIGALDTIIVDFCKGFDDSRMAMLILRQEMTRAGVDINDPTWDCIKKAIEYLAEAEMEFKDERAVRKNLERWKGWVYKVGEK
jgi:small GTP-binding protein